MFLFCEVRKWLRLFGVDGLGKPRKRFVHITHGLLDRRVMSAMKFAKFVKQILAINMLATPNLPTADNLKNHPIGTVRNPALLIDGSDFLDLHESGLATIIGVALN